MCLSKQTKGSIEAVSSVCQFMLDLAVTETLQAARSNWSFKLILFASNTI